jgi:hypothetical protein
MDHKMLCSVVEGPRLRNGRRKQPNHKMWTVHNTL